MSKRPMTLSGRRILVASGILVLLNTSGLADERSYMESSSFCSLRCEKMRAKSVEADATELAARVQRTDETRQAYGRALQSYQNALSRTDWTGIILDVNNQMVGDIVSLAPVVGTLVKKQLKWIEDMYKEQKAGLLHQDAMGIVWTLRKGMTEETWSGLTGANVAARASTLKELSKGAFSSFDQIKDQGARDAIQNELLQYMANNLEALSQVVFQQQFDIQNLHNGYAALAAEDRDLQAAIQKISSQEQSASSDAMLAGNTGAKSAGRIARETQFEAAKRLQLQKISSVAKDVSDQAAIAGEVFARLNKPNEAKIARAVAGGAALIAGVAESFVNPLAILPTLNTAMGLFGGPAPDPLQEVLLGQQKILEAIEAISKQMEKDHQETMKSLGAIDRSVNIVMAQAAEILAGNLNSCINLIPENARDLRRWPKLNWTFFSSYGEFDRHVRQHAEKSIENCLEVLGKHFATPSFGPNEQPSKLFLMLASGDIQDVNEGQKREADVEIDNYTKAFALVSSLLNERALLSLALPASSRAQLLYKIEKLKAADIAYPGEKQFFWMYAPNLLNSKALQKSATMMVGIHGYFELVSNGRVIDKAAFERPTNDRVWSLEGYDRLLTASDYVRVARMQHSLLAGDVLLPLVDKVIRKNFDFEEFKHLLKDVPANEPAAEKEKRQAALYSNVKILIQKNPILARNWLTYVIVSSLRGTGQSSLVYEIGLASKNDPSLLAKVAKLPVKAEPSSPKKSEEPPFLSWSEPTNDNPSGWSINVDDVKIPLPTATDVANETLHTSLDGASLRQVAHALSREIATYGDAKSDKGMRWKEIREIRQSLILGMDLL